MGWLRRLLLLTGFTALCLGLARLSVHQNDTGTPVGAEAADARAPAIRAAVEAARDADPVSDRQALSALYGALGYAPLWLDADGRPTREADDAVTLLTAAALEGLEPGDYAAAGLAERLANLRSGSTADEAVQATADVGLSRSVLRYLRELHTGRVDARAFGLRIAVRREEPDYAVELRKAVAAHRLPAVAASLVPPLVMYRELRSALATYRSLAVDGWLPTVPAPATGSVRVGERYTGLAPLWRLLVALGDLPPGAPEPPPGSSYDGALVEGVRRFQERHGLTGDGVLDRQTLDALGVSPARRARQIELSLERLRWLPRPVAGRRLIGVNIPMFRLWAVDSPEKAVPTRTMAVIVGRALHTQTPMLVEQMESVIFRPYWNVPASILKSEVLPALRRDSTYADREDMEIVSGETDAATVVTMSADALDRLARGELRIRQRPGPRNALGLVKFVFPNAADVYMHGTPTPELFGRARRDFSHGCIRVEDPIGLAEWVLQDQGWTRERIVETMEGTSTQEVALREPIQVVLYYLGALVVPGDGRVFFADDIYGLDPALERALAARRGSG
jgi:murein L,D-transpeptidase YcbB/YkuD